MDWVRSHRRFGGWVALFALILQLGLSFGHVHAMVPDRPAAWTVSATPASPRPNTGTHDDDYCAICAVLAMLSGAQAATPPDIALPVAVASTEIAVVTRALRLDSTRVLFRSRAPPQA